MFPSRTTGKSKLKPADLILTAKRLCSAGRKPRQSDLRRASSTAYYAMFHTLCRSCADLLVGGQGANRSQPAWRQVYRSLNHATVKDCCRITQIIRRFPQEIQDFANEFVNQQEKRHLADYDPDVRLVKSVIVNDIRIVEALIKSYGAVPISDRRAFAALVLLGRPRS